MSAKRLTARQIELLKNALQLDLQRMRKTANKVDEVDGGSSNVDAFHTFNAGQYRQAEELFDLLDAADDVVVMHS
ncbi:hypothetical protein [Mesorhizobium australicum]|uniref:hypothetical protein n=1 Tax=Mesorhizobium australicum TaxID=536018 RepID=UPI00333B1221